MHFMKVLQNFILFTNSTVVFYDSTALRTSVGRPLIAGHEGVVDNRTSCCVRTDNPTSPHQMHVSLTRCKGVHTDAYVKGATEHRAARPPYAIPRPLGTELTFLGSYYRTDTWNYRLVQA